MTQELIRPTRQRPPGHPRGAAAATGRGLNLLARVSPRLAGRVAVELWRRPGRVATVHPDEQRVLDEARVATVGGEGRRVVTYAWGDGERPVLLVHGWAARSSRFADLVDLLLAEGWSPVAYDAWGHGGSRGPVRTILDHERVIAELGERHGPFQGA